MSQQSHKRGDSTRRFAAIMFTDVVGYTALMGSDEEKAFDLLNKNRKIQRSLIEKFSGRFLKEMGDGILASFDTSTDAVRCAGAIQNAVRAEDFSLRIGIHQGEVVFKANDVIGDGVNVASRLEEIAGAGCTNISGAVYKDVKNKKGITTEFLEEKELKNVDEPVKIYKVTSEEEEEDFGIDKIAEESKSGRKREYKLLYYILAGLVLGIGVILILKLSDWPEKDSPSVDSLKDKSIAVIPFWNDSPDPDNEYFCSGMEEEIRIQLLKISDLKVESRQSVEKYRENPDKDIITIGSELEVSYIVEGSVRKIGDDIRVTVQLIDAGSGDHIWGDTYDGDYTVKLLDFQSNTAKEIVSSLNAAITPMEENLLARKQTQSIEAYDNKLRGDKMWNNYWTTLDLRFLDSAHLFYDRALEIDPDYKNAITRKTRAYLDQGVYDSVLVYADRQISLDPTSAEGYNFKGEAYRSMGKIDLAIEFLEMASDRSPGEIWYHLILSTLYCHASDNCIEGYKHLQKVLEKDLGRSPNVHYYIAWFYLNIGEYDKAEKYIDRSLEYGKTCPGLFNQSEILQAQEKYLEALQYTVDNCAKFKCAASWCEYIQISNLRFLKRYDDILEVCENFDAEGIYKDIIDCHKVLAYWKLGNINTANKIFNDLVERIGFDKLGSFQVFVSIDLHYQLAGLYAILEKRDKAMEMVKDYSQDIFCDGKIDCIPNDPFYEVLREDPEFKDILKRKQEERAAVLAQIKEMETGVKK